MLWSLELPMTPTHFGHFLLGGIICRQADQQRKKSSITPRETVRVPPSAERSHLHQHLFLFYSFTARDVATAKSNKCTNKCSIVNLGCPLGFSVSQCLGASWVRASSSQSSLSDSGSSRDCKKCNLAEKILQDLEYRRVLRFSIESLKLYLFSSGLDCTRLSRYARKWLRSAIATTSAGVMVG